MTSSIEGLVTGSHQKDHSITENFLQYALLLTQNQKLRMNKLKTPKQLVIGQTMEDR